MVSVQDATITNDNEHHDDYALPTPPSITETLPLPATPIVTSPDKAWIRGVNVGGWLTLERYIVPYQFAITSCHLRGDFCWYADALGAPPVTHPDYQLCSDVRDTCEPVQKPNVYGNMDYPFDEYNLGAAFPDPRIGAQWLDYHFRYFLSRSDLERLVDAKVTHVRIPIPHWIMGDVQDGEPWIVGSRWRYFLRALGWCRELGLKVWPDIHTAPGSQNGFDNSGQQLPGVSCRGWADEPHNVARSLTVIRDVVDEIVREGYGDVVTGFGLLNEPFKDCPRDVYLDFIDQGLDIVREALGPETAVYVSDLFSAMSFNDGSWWLDPSRYNHTYLDSHYYHVFAEHPRALSPRQHIAYTCQSEYHARLSDSGSASCCYTDAPVYNATPSVDGVQRLIGEWSAATDTLPVAMLDTIMAHIATHGTALRMNRTLSPARQDFLRHFVHAQMVAYEAADVGVGAGWFYWTLKMEGGAFAEWDFLRGVEEGWIVLPASHHTPAQAEFGTCYEIVFQTDDDPSIIDEFPPPTDDDANNWQGVVLDDDVVVSHGQSLLSGGGGRKQYNDSISENDTAGRVPTIPSHQTPSHWMLGTVLLILLVVGAGWRWQRQRSTKQADYEQIEEVGITV